MVVALFLAVTTAYATYPIQFETAWSDTGRRFTSMEACQDAGRRASTGVLPSYRCEWHEGSL